MRPHHKLILWLGGAFTLAAAVFVAAVYLSGGAALLAGTSAQAQTATQVIAMATPADPATAAGPTALPASPLPPATPVKTSQPPSSPTAAPPSATPIGTAVAAAAMAASTAVSETIFLPFIMRPLRLPPYISNITPHAAEIFQRGQSLGNRAQVFALVGDSNTANPAFFAPFDQGGYSLGSYASLQDTITYFQGSFDRQCPWPCTPAAKGSFNTYMELTLQRDLAGSFSDSRCLLDETPLACEYRLQQPSVALILLGTGDHLAADWPSFEGRYRQIIEYTQAQGVIPVLITKADDLESSEQGAPYDFINGIIRRLSGEYGVPLLDLRQAVDSLPNHGLSPDNIHYSTPPDGRTADLTSDHLNYGFTLRNLTGLQVLEAIKRQVISP